MKIAAALTLLVALVQGSFRLVNSPGGDVLIARSRRFLLDDKPGLPNYPDEIKVDQSHLNDIVAKWLEQRRIPGDPDPIRNCLAKGATVDLQDCVSIAPHTYLGILNLESGDSGPAYSLESEQLLVRLAGPSWTLEPVRILRQIVLYDYAAWYGSRLFETTRGIFLMNPGKVVRLDRTGAEKGQVCEWGSNEEFHGVVANRWAVGTVEGPDSVRIVLRDLTSGKTFDLIHSPIKQTDIWGPPTLIHNPRGDSPFLLFAEQNNKSEDVKCFTIHVPDRARALLVTLKAARNSDDTPPIPDQFYLAGTYAIHLDEPTAKIYSASSGKLLATVPFKFPDN
jgi:hypothetical protein